MNFYACFPHVLPVQVKFGVMLLRIYEFHDSQLEKGANFCMGVN